MADIPSTMQAVVLTGPGEWELRRGLLPSRRARMFSPRSFRGYLRHRPEHHQRHLSRHVALALPFHHRSRMGRRSSGHRSRSRELAGHREAIRPGHQSSRRGALRLRHLRELPGGRLRLSVSTMVTTRWAIITTASPPEGAYATYVKTSVKSIHPLPENLSSTRPPCLIWLGSRSTASTVPGVKVGESCCVTGPGRAGSMTLQLCKAAGAKKVIMVGRGQLDPRSRRGLSLAAPVDYEKTDDVVKAVWDLDRRPGCGRCIRARRYEGIVHQVAAHGAQGRQAGHDRPGRAYSHRVEQAYSRPGQLHRRANPNTLDVAGHVGGRPGERGGLAHPFLPTGPVWRSPATFGARAWKRHESGPAGSTVWYRYSRVQEVRGAVWAPA